MAVNIGPLMIWNTGYPGKKKGQYQQKEGEQKANEKKQTIKKVIEENNPSIVMFQEFPTTSIRQGRWKDHELPIYYTYFRSKNDINRNCLLYDKNQIKIESIKQKILDNALLELVREVIGNSPILPDITSLEYLRKAIHFSPDTRMCVGIVKTNDNFKFMCVSWHGRHRTTDDIKKIEFELLVKFVKKISEKLEDLPYIIAGDFNLSMEKAKTLYTEDIKEYTPVRGRRNSLIDFYIHSNDIILDDIEAVQLDSNQNGIFDHDPVMVKTITDLKALGLDKKTENDDSKTDHNGPATVQTISNYSKGFGGKYGVQTDRKDQSAMGWDYQEKLEKHESQKDYSKGSWGKYGVQSDRVDKSAVGFDYQEKLEKHESQKDYSKGFGGKFGVQTDRVDQSAVGFDYQEKLQKHESQTDYSKGFGGKYGVQEDRVDKSALGYDHQEKLEKHESQKDYSKGFGGKYGVQKDRVDQSAAGYDSHEKVALHSSQTDSKRGFGGKFGVEEARQDQSAGGYGDMQGASTTYQKTRASSGSEGGVKSLRSRFENMAKAGEEEAKEKADEKRARRKAREEKEAEMQRKQQEIDDGWWRGECRGKTGLFPANYVELQQ